MTDAVWDAVGPVILAGPEGDAVCEAIRDENAQAQLINHGAYIRVLVPKRCAVSRTAIEMRLGKTFNLPADLEPLMPSFKGTLTVSEDEVVWSLSATAKRAPA